MVSVHPHRRPLGSLKMFVVVTTQGGSVLGLQWVEVKDAAKCPLVLRTVLSPTQSIILAKVSVAPRLRKLP